MPNTLGTSIQGGAVVFATGRQWKFFVVIAAIAVMILVAALVTFSFTDVLQFEPELTGDTAADKAVVVALYSELKDLDGYVWPSRMHVAGKRLSLWYRNWIPSDGSEWDAEVQRALPEEGEGWTLVYRRARSNEIYRTVRLPVAVQDDDL